jgi:hypothetical protein
MKIIIFALQVISSVLTFETFPFEMRMISAEIRIRAAVDSICDAITHEGRLAMGDHYRRARTVPN